MTHELTTTSILALFQTSKEERASFVQDVLAKIENGEVDPLAIHLQVKCTEDIIKQITGNDKYTKAIVDEAEKQGQKSFQFHNAKFEIKEVGTKYDWSKCNDPELEQLLSEQEKIDAKVKERQEFLKTVPEKGMEVLIGDELVTVYRPAKSSKTSVAVSLK